MQFLEEVRNQLRCKIAFMKKKCRYSNDLKKLLWTDEDKPIVSVSSPQIEEPYQNCIHFLEVTYHENHCLLRMMR